MSETQALVALLQAALSDKLGQLLAMVTSALGFAWVLHDPDWIRYASATTYCLVTYYATRRKPE
mgnify:FL=1